MAGQFYFPLKVGVLVVFVEFYFILSNTSMVIVGPTAAMVLLFCCQ